MNNPKFKTLLEELIENDDKKAAREQRQQKRQQAQESKYDALGRKGSTLLYEIANDPQVIDVLQRHEKRLTIRDRRDQTPYISASKELCEYSMDAKGKLHATDGFDHLPYYGDFDYGCVHTEPAVIIIGPGRVSLGQILDTGKILPLEVGLEGRRIYSLQEECFTSNHERLQDVKLGNVIAGSYGTFEQFKEDVYHHVTQSLDALKTRKRSSK